MPNIVLASQSPRRQELLRRMGIEHFSVVVPNTDESYPAGLSAQETVSLIARKKADAAARLASPDDIVITADTMVFLDDERLGKPHDEADALRMLTELSGRAHTVCTGVTVRRGDNLECFTVSTEVYFRSASRQELLGYIATGEPMDKAGAYGAQGRGALFVRAIEGDFFNVMGLPLCRLGQMLKKQGVELL
jgi:septum formation protein